jgi:hypothetical protein
MDVADIKSVSEYFELLMHGGVVDRAHSQKNGVGAGILTFNVVLMSIVSKAACKTLSSDFGTVQCVVVLF